MLFVDRSVEPPPPGYFASEAAGYARQALRDFLQLGDQRLAQSSARVLPASKLDGDPDVSEALTRMFGGKCAFCESRAPTRPYRFRPAAEATPVLPARQGPDTAHLYYAWLAEAWQNIYPICMGCAPREPDHFPVTGARCRLPDDEQLDEFVNRRTGLWPAWPISENEVLLDPGRDLPFDRHLRVYADGVLEGASPRGSATLQHFGLNRQELVERRAGVFDRYIGSLSQAIEHGLEQDRFDNIFDFRALEFGGVWYLLLRDLARQLRAQGGGRPKLGRSDIGDYLAGFARDRRHQEIFAAALEELREGISQAKPRVAADLPPDMAASRLAIVEVSNFKGLEHLVLPMPATPDTPDGSARDAGCVVVLGENATGKSSLLEAIALALCSSGAKEALKLVERDFLLDPALLGGSGKLRQASVDLRFEDGGHLPLRIDEGTIWEAGERPETMPVFAYGAFRHYRAERKQNTVVRPVRNLFRPDALLSNPEPWLLRLPETRFNMVVRALREILSVDGDFECLRRDRESGRCFLVQPLGPGGSPVETPLSMVSSGFRTVLAIMGEVMESLMALKGFETLDKARAVILIDEIEAHLHPRWKIRIMRSLRTALPQATFICTTHDPLCLRGMRHGEVVVLRRVAGEMEPGSGLATFVEPVPDLPDITRMRLEQLLTSDLFQMFSTDSLEGETLYARMASLISRREAGEDLSDREAAALAAFQDEIATALPVGSSEVQRIVQKAVAEYLKDRRQGTAAEVAALADGTRARIRAALERS